MIINCIFRQNRRNSGACALLMKNSNTLLTITNLVSVTRYYNHRYYKPYNIVGNLGSYPGSLDRATGEKVTVSEVFPAFRGTDSRQSVLGSWGPSAAREGRPKGDIISLTSSCIPPIIILFLILSLLLRIGGGLSSKRDRETEVRGRNEVSVSLSTCMSEVTWGGTAWNAKLTSLGFVLNSTGFKSGLALSSLSNLALMSVKVELVVSD